MAAWYQGIIPLSQLFVRAASDEVGLRRESRVDDGSLPMWLARLHWSLPVGTEVRITISGGPSVLRPSDMLEGAGFGGAGPTYERLQSLPDTVAPGIKTLVVGLNPGFSSADAGIPFANPTNRFWTAANAAGLVTVDRDTERALGVDRVGFTDLVKRTTRTADEIGDSEYAAGLQRLQRLVRWAQPNRVLVVGLAGWRSAVSRRAASGWQDPSDLDVATYLMPSTSGLNAHASAEDLADHIRAALKPPS